MLHNEFDPPPSWYEPTWDWPEDHWGCTMAGTMGRHSDDYYDEGQCAWCDARRDDDDV